MVFAVDLPVFFEGGVTFRCRSLLAGVVVVVVCCCLLLFVANNNNYCQQEEARSKKQEGVRPYSPLSIGQSEIYKKHLEPENL